MPKRTKKASAYNNGAYVTVKGQSGKRWRVLPDLQPPRSLLELQRVRREAILAGRGGGVPLAQLEPDPFNLVERLSKKDWEYTRGKLTFDDRPRTSSPKKLLRDSSVLSDDDDNRNTQDRLSQSIDNVNFTSLFEARPTTCPPTSERFQPSASAILLRPSTSTSLAGNNRQHPHSQSVPALLPFPHEDPFSAARPSTTESNNGMTHLKLHINANRIPPGGFRQRPTSRGVISTIGGHYFPGLRPSICKRDFYIVPDRGAFGVVKQKVDPKTTKESSRPASASSHQKNKSMHKSTSKNDDDDDDDDESKPLLLAKRLKRFQLGIQLEVRELDHKFTGLFRPAFVHHIHNTGFLDVLYPVDGLNHYRFHVDPRAARHPPDYHHKFSLSAPIPQRTAIIKIKKKGKKYRKKNDIETKETKEEQEEHEKRQEDEKQRRFELEQSFAPFRISKIIPAVRPCTVSQDSILNDILPIPIHVKGWANASICSDFRLASVLPLETKMFNKSVERTKRIDISVQHGTISSTESLRVTIPYVQRVAWEIVPLLCVFMRWRDVHSLLLSCTGTYECSRWECKLLWEKMLLRDMPWAHKLLRRADKHRRRQLANAVVEAATKNKIKEATDRAWKKARAWASRANAHLADMQKQSSKNIAVERVPASKDSATKNIKEKRKHSTVVAQSLTKSTTLKDEMDITSSAGFDQWTSLVVRTQPTIDTRKPLNDPVDNGAIQDVLHSPKHLYLCVSWCIRASHQQLMIVKFINSIEALNQPPIALNVLMEHFTIKERGDLEEINGAIPEPFIRTAEALLALLGKDDEEPAWQRPHLPTARASHAWKWLRRMLFGNCSQFESDLRTLDPDDYSPTGQRISRARVALACKSYDTESWLALRTEPGCLLIELFRRWALSIVRFSQARGLGDPLEERSEYYQEMKEKIETGIARGIGQGLLWNEKYEKKKKL